jgi:hypothetical protein
MGTMAAGSGRTDPASKSDDEEMWQVALAPGEIKLVNLEQLDDLFRLEIIDEKTKVRRGGVGEWLPLSVVADIDEASAPPAQQEATPRVTPVAAVLAEARSESPTSVTPLTPQSISPIAVSNAPAAKRGGMSRAERWLLAVAALSGLGVTLYRNDVLHGLARSAGKEAAYFRVEAALGGPGFGTPRSVERLSAAALASPSPSLPAPEARVATPSAAMPAPVAAPAASAVAAATSAAPAKTAEAPSERVAPRVHPTAADGKKSRASRRSAAGKASPSEFDPMNPKL